MGDKNLSRREREKLMHREEMLAVALDLFSEKGYHNVSMHEIARKSEFAIGTLYKFFKNKEDLYKALIMTRAEEYHRILKEALGQKDDVLTALRKYIAAKARIFAENVPTLRLYFVETRGASFTTRAGLDQDIRKLYDEVIELLASVFEKGMAKKVFRKLDPYYMAVALEGLTNAFLYCWLEDPAQHPYEANVPVIADMFLNGILIK